MLERRWSTSLRLTILSERRPAVLARQTPLQVSWSGPTSANAASRTASRLARHRTSSPPGPEDGRWTDFFNGRIEDPAIFPGLHSTTPRRSSRTRPACFAWWDFSREIPIATASSTAAPHALSRHRCISCRPVPSRLALDRRGDVLAASRLGTTQPSISRGRPLRLRLGDRLRGRRSLRHEERRLRRAAALRRGEQDIVPFYVSPPAGADDGTDRSSSRRPSPTRSTGTTGAATSTRLQRPAGRMGRLSAERRKSTLNTAPSTYNPHPDGMRHLLFEHAPAAADDAAGIHSPITMRGLRAAAFPGRQPSGRRAEAKGFAFDVVTDHDLDREGVD